MSNCPNSFFGESEFYQGDKQIGHCYKVVCGDFLFLDYKSKEEMCDFGVWIKEEGYKRIYYWYCSVECSRKTLLNIK